MAFIPFYRRFGCLNELLILERNPLVFPFLLKMSSEYALIQCAQALQKFLSFLELREEFFFFSKGRGMDQAPAAAEFDRVTQMQHFVIDEIFNGIERDARGIENAADDDCVVRRIVVAQTPEGLVAAPGHLWPSH